MLKTRLLHVVIEKCEDGKFFIHATDENGIHVSPTDWKRQLFIWHKESFFGTSLSLEQHHSIEGVKVTSWELLTLLATESFSSIIQWEWDELGQMLLSTAFTMHEAIIKGSFSPVFTQDKQMIQWPLPSLVIDDFHDSFWEQTFNDRTVQSIIGNWFQSAVDHYFQTKPEISDKINHLLTSGLSAEELTLYFDEVSFQKWLGIENDRPFEIGLRLSEPEEDHDSWKLETVLRDRGLPDRLYSMKDSPARWKPFIAEVSEEYHRWLKLFPWLKGVNGLTEELDEDQAWLFLTEASEKLHVLGVEILLPSWWMAMKDAQIAVKAKMKQTNTSHSPSFVGLNAMIDFDWRLSVNGSELSEDDFQQLIESQRKLIKLNGQWVRFDPKMIKQIQDLMKRAKKEGLTVRDIFEQELIIDDVEVDEDFNPKAFAKIQIELNRSIKKLIQQLTDLTNIPQLPVPNEFQGHLRPYQVQGYSWLAFLRKFHFGAILADDMGLGKTIQLIAYLLHVKKFSKSNAPSLIICPTSVLGNWQKEFVRFAPNLNVILHYGPNRPKGDYFGESLKDADVILTTYGLSHLDFDELSGVDWSTVAIDEAQNIKNSGTKQSRAIRKLNGEHKIALTGTPMENRLSELWSIFDFTNHGFLGTFSQFQKKYILPIEKDGLEGKIRELQSLIRPFLLRRTKQDPEVELNLPDKIEEKEYCPLTTEQASLYEQLIRDTFDQIETLSSFERKGLILKMLNHLKQLCNHPALYLKEERPNNVVKRSHKIEKLIELLTSVLDANEGCLIFTQYIGMGKIIQETLNSHFNLDVPFLNGSMPKAKRDEYVQSFQNGEFPIFLISLKAGGTGLNLTAANHVIHFDRWWNPAVENQATDRVYRIGQSRFVHVHKFITTGTLEEKIDAMLEKKQALNDEIIQSDNWITELSNIELQDLLALS
ncbi:DEAD/DEAH box helicase [Heyndrickxia vini]|uniref:DEAD/DEAH box helicase n=1 Tax=Heyndrickxia vini TaxID=1476025 RepID=A0ABX7E0C5_9BACI|nr:DEAD/DEAH box helicase [Heyndrickxia vini]QQZ09189.1 DEAD/DEAH box helicase [Heyndrickxia vini]